MTERRGNVGEDCCQIPERDRRFLQGIALFNAGDYFEAHDEWEALWQEYHGPDRAFLKGLIQTAVCLHHFGNGNVRGAAKLYHGSRRYLAPYVPVHWGVDVAWLLDQMKVGCGAVLEASAPREDLPPCPPIELRCAGRAGS